MACALVGILSRTPWLCNAMIFYFSCLFDRGQFIIEYVGEILDQEQFEERAEQYNNEGQLHFYFMTLQSNQIIDATRKGNLSRFMNHSCNPNCATQKWIVRGRLRIGLFAVRRIKMGTELTFDYKFIRFGAQAQNCLCGEACCKGVIGEEWKETATPLGASDRPIKATKQEEDDSEYAISRFTGEMGVKNVEDLTLLARVLLRTEERDAIVPLLQTLRKTKDSFLLKRFLSLHGLQIISVLIGSHWRDCDLINAAISVLDWLPIVNRNCIEDANLEEKVEKLAHREDLDSSLKAICKELLENWRRLEKIFRIPKASVALVPNVEGKDQAAPPSSSDTALSVATGYTISSADTQFIKKSSWQQPERSKERTIILEKEYNGLRSDPRNNREDRDRGGQRKRYRSPSPPSLKRSSTVLPDGWKIAYTKEREPYYYNRETRETRWNPPPLKPRESATGLSTADSNEKLHEIIERAKKAALTRLNSNQPALDGQRRKSPCPETPTSDGSSVQEEWVRLESTFKEAVSQTVVKYLSRWCKSQIDSQTKFKDLAKKLTHGIVDKEFRSLKERHDEKHMPSAEEWSEYGAKELTLSKRAKVKVFLIKYLQDHGYRISENPGATEK